MEFKICETKLDRENMRLSESIMSMANEYMGTRGNFEEFYSGDSLQGSYIGGVWYPDKTRVGWWKNGYPDYFGKMINSPNFIGIDIEIDKEILDLYKEDVKEYHRELDMKKAILTRSFIFSRGDNTYKVDVKRFFSADIKELALIKYDIELLDGSSKILLSPYIDADVLNEDANYEEGFWQIIDKDKDYIEVKTKENNFGVERFSLSYTMKSILHLNRDGKNYIIEPQDHIIEDMKVASQFSLDMIKGDRISLEKYIVITSSRDMNINQLRYTAKEILAKALDLGYDELLDRHASVWKDRWNRADIVIKNKPKLQEAIRYNLFQLFSTYYGKDERLNIGPKGFTGEKYGGATYWDTEAYILPMYMSTADKDVCRNLLKYRFNQLKEAYINASKQGLKGALYPMVTFNGIECHNEWEITFEEIHRNSAIAYAIYNYVNYTGDREYIKEYGIDVLLGIARFWADRVHYNPRKDVYMIHGVTGPNEYENNVNNNYYTNMMAAWVLDFVGNLALEEDLSQKVKIFGIKAEELTKWKEIVEKIYLPKDEESGLLLQQDGFMDKELLTVDDIKDQRPINQNWSWDKILRSCFIKQADLLQGMYFFPDKFSDEEVAQNFKFYEPMTVHESSLSASIHSILAARIGHMDKAVEMYERTARLDLDNYNKDTEDGLHITSMSGAWLSIVHGFAGMRVRNNILEFSPRLAKSWDGYLFNINFRDRIIKLDTDRDMVTVSLVSGEKLYIKLYGRTYLLEDECKVRLKEKQAL